MSTMTAHTAAAAPKTSFSVGRVVSWLVAKDQAYKSQQAMRDLPPHLLQDVGLEDTHYGLRRR